MSTEDFQIIADALVQIAFSLILLAIAIQVVRGRLLSGVLLDFIVNSRSAFDDVEDELVLDFAELFHVSPEVALGAFELLYKAGTGQDLQPKDPDTEKETHGGAAEG